LRGIDTHGVLRVPGYIDKIRSGEVNARPTPTREVQDGVVRYDGDGGIGQAVMTTAIQAAIDVARDRQVTTCLVRRSGHLAAIGMFALPAAEAGLVAVLCQETPPLMAPLGSKRPAIGNNPIAFACPVEGRAPLVFDMATSVVARGSVLDAAREGHDLPPGWAIDDSGQPAQDPAAALAGSMLPVGGHKGVGLAMMVQVLAGSLTGSVAAESARKHAATSSAGNVSAFLLLINPDAAAGRTAFDGHIRSWLDYYLDASGPDGRYPGARAAAVEAERTRTGIPLTPAGVSELVSLGARLNVPFDLLSIT
jgi:LDH2 family malate/lactate/ureidoglycolate dehydrogenase